MSSADSQRMFGGLAKPAGAWPSAAKQIATKIKRIVMPRIYRLSTGIALRKNQALGHSGIKQRLRPRAIRLGGIEQALVQPGIGVQPKLHLAGLEKPA